MENGYSLQLAYNNRGVMHYMNGDTVASKRDLDIAATIGMGYGVASRNLAQLQQ